MINAGIGLCFGILILITAIKHLIDALRMKTVSTDDIVNDFNWSPEHVVLVFGSIYIGSWIKGANIDLFSDGVLNTFYIVFGIGSIVYWFKNKPLGLFLEHKKGIKLIIMLLFGLSVGLLF
ncbi:hypothetical protein ABNB59_21390 [Paenibacillus larvae]|uniref:Uncharacterized protein n=4 Tax=Paenibacillus larvae TaxID=1464 RepID=V9W1N2_9BACL|nr:hypothetical protein [Paenibacillus larvae]AHD04911.1 hypothetical protein ERIC2_c10760 [Paenibacillus larvae subsp. larvae DSM 25430]AQR76206.1 hypothetical protein BXP28_01050 [Paenibacillus larvae subsp. larvae]AVF23022.1 hypothetical protein ERICI_03248 [Paenibacillus larvae subsp. larvae]AVG11455.1 hypothetical protein ERICII_01036 [Paenibacillus larvae subsp. larvae DSM 25430]ETK26311.1 hypothetical protein ERIC1_2c05090 [Paenibacillus larvae subsp. larvae DSM 25719]